MTSKKSTETLTFEEALSELEEIVKKIDTGQENLTESVESFERGIALKKHCEKMLNDARLKIEKIVKDENGDLQTEEFKL